MSAHRHDQYALRARGLWAVLLALAAAAPARANMAALEVRPSGLAGPRFLGPTPLSINRELLAFDCSETRGVPTCTFEARYRFRNPTQDPTVALCAFYGIRTRDVRVTLDGAETATPLDAEARARLDQAVLKGPGGYAWNHDPTLVADQFGFTVAAAAGSEHELRVTGSVDFVPDSPGRFYGATAVVARHLQFAARDTERGYLLDYLLSPIKTWGGDPEISLRVRYPATWKVHSSWSDEHVDEGSVVHDGRFEVGSWRFRASAARSELRLVVDTHPPERSFRFGFEAEAPPFTNGGPLLGLGGGSGFLVRFGYDVARKPWFLCQLAVDTNLRDRVVVAPALVLAAPALLFLPSVGAGFGLPVQLAPEVRVGARLQLDLMLYAVGFVASVDLFPASGAQAGKAQVALLGQLGL